MSLQHPSPAGGVGRRDFLRAASLSAGACAVGAAAPARAAPARPPNVVFVFADEWRAHDFGFAGNADVPTPHFDAMARDSLCCSSMISGCPVCTPYRASLLTGQYWLTHGLFYNDKPLGNRAVSLAQAFKAAGYDTAYVGKWHVDGHGRDAFIPRERRQGFDYWKACECTHDYNRSLYYADTPQPLFWEGYDAVAQTRDMLAYIRGHDRAKPFLFVLSWGPPHTPHHTAPDVYKKRIAPAAELTVRPNVPEERRDKARQALAGYYAHIAALDDCMGEIRRTLKETGLEENTILVFTTDHGYMIHSQGQLHKQMPWEESIRVPFLLQWPALRGTAGRTIGMPINTPDIMPTLLGLSGAPIPKTVEGRDLSPVFRGEREESDDPALIMCPVPFHQWNFASGGREYRGVRTRTHTYVRDLKGPWLLYDNAADPYQLNNLAGKPEAAELQARLEAELVRKLRETGDEFRPAQYYMDQWHYTWDGKDAPA
ncbi:MAG TPA: sulfatase [Planctomycetota bacterium]|nr:sulfatase [Planctomycetota bacterium]HRT97616.1 sulfatase [Planctomycetota bacterium]